MSITQVELKHQSRRLAGALPDWTLLELKDKNVEFMLTKNEFRTIRGKVYGLEYTVLYSDSYEVPVMYFTAFGQDGTVAELDEISENGLSDMTISQIEHPVYFRPFFQVHPCRTKEFMKCHNISNYLLAWLTTVGNLIGLKVELTSELSSILFED